MRIDNPRLISFIRFFCLGNIYSLDCCIIFGIASMVPGLLFGIVSGIFFGFYEGIAILGFLFSSICNDNLLSRILMSLFGFIGCAIDILKYVFLFLFLGMNIGNLLGYTMEKIKLNIKDKRH